MNEELVRFVREALARGIPRSEIRSRLLEARWQDDEVGEALAAFADVEFPIPVPRPRAYRSARDAFLCLALFSTLYLSAVSLGSLFYQFIDRAFPDPAIAARLADELAGVRWWVSSLLIAFPVFLLLSRTMYRAIRRDPEKRTSKIRKWLTYLTLFLAGAVLLGDLVTLVFNLLGGELTTRFLLKVLTVGAIAGSVFGYYLWDLRQADVEPERWAGRHPGLRAFAGLVVAAVATAIVAGLLLAGSPERARSARLDDLRERDLQAISRAVDLYWSRTGQLPADLERLGRERDVRLRSIHDPESREPYEYRVTGDKSYELCAIFDREDPGPSRQGAPAERFTTGDRFWTHGAGRVCFDVEAVTLERVVPAPELEERRTEPDPREPPRRRP